MVEKNAKVLRPHLNNDHLGDNGLPKNLQHLSEEKAHESVKLGAFDIWALGIKLLVVNILVGILFPQF